MEVSERVSGDGLAAKARSAWDQIDTENEGAGVLLARRQKNRYHRVFRGRDKNFGRGANRSDQPSFSRAERVEECVTDFREQPCIQAAQAGDSTAFGLLVAAYWTPIQRWLLAMTHHV